VEVQHKKRLSQKSFRSSPRCIGAIPFFQGMMGFRLKACLLRQLADSAKARSEWHFNF